MFLYIALLSRSLLFRASSVLNAVGSPSKPPMPSGIPLYLFALLSLCVVCGCPMVTAEPVLVDTAGLQDRRLNGIDSGVRGGGQAGNGRWNPHDPLVPPSSDPQAGRG